MRDDVVAVAAAQSHGAVGQDAAFEEGVERVFDELWQVGAASEAHASSPSNSIGLQADVRTANGGRHETACTDALLRP